MFISANQALEQVERLRCLGLPLQQSTGHIADLIIPQLLSFSSGLLKGSTVTRQLLIEFSLYASAQEDSAQQASLPIALLSHQSVMCLGVPCHQSGHMAHLITPQPVSSGVNEVNYVTRWLQQLLTNQD